MTDNELLEQILYELRKLNEDQELISAQEIVRLQELRKKPA